MKIAIITGASGGLARSLAPSLLEGDWTPAAMALLLSEETAWITGQILSVDGGFTAVRPMVRK